MFEKEGDIPKDFWEIPANAKSYTDRILENNPVGSRTKLSVLALSRDHAVIFLSKDIVRNGQKKEDASWLTGMTV